jgi:hypothetical protein
MYNINYGHNEEKLKSCATLHQYSIFRQFSNMLPEIMRAAQCITLYNGNIRVKSFSAFPTRCVVINADCADLPTILIYASEKSLKSNGTSLVASFTAKLTVIIDCNHILLLLL